MSKINYLLLAAFSFSSPIYAITEVVPSGNVHQRQVVLLTAGDEAIVEKGGVIAIQEECIILFNDNQKILNLGSLISTNANGARVESVADNCMIINSGLISAGITGTNRHAILNDGTNTLIINSGRILNTTTLGVTGNTIQNLGDNVLIINSGLIFSIRTEAIANPLVMGASGENAFIINSGTIKSIQLSAISSITPNFTLINSGIVSTDGADVFAVNRESNNTLIKNSGLIFGSRGSNGAIFIRDGENHVVVNSGILASNGDLGGVIATVGGVSVVENLQIINSGTIQRQDPTTSQIALNLIDISNPTLSLLRGSNIEGDVLAVGDPLDLNVETGLNLVLTLDPGSVGFGTLGIEAPFVLLDDTILVIDPTGFAMQNDVLSDLSDTIFDGIYRHRAGFACPCPPCGSGVWVQGIGSSRGRSIDSKRVGYDNWQGGFLVGYNTSFCRGYGSLFGGISFGEAEVDGQTQRADWTTYLGGLTYEWLYCNTYLGLAYAIGYVDWNNERFVMNNLADGGVQTATFDTGGAFISSEATIAQHFPWMLSPTLSFTFRYAGLFLADYKESGSDSDISVNNRQVDLLTTRLEAAFPFQNAKRICCWVVEPYFGLYGRYQVGGRRVDTIFGGQSRCFDPGNPDSLVAFLFGFRGTQSLGRFNLFVNLEGSFDSSSSARILGEGGIGFRF